MRILLVTQWFQPEQAYKGISFAKMLMDRGHEVQVLTGFPNFPTGKIFPGYKIRLFQKEVMDGVEVVRVPLYPSHDSSAVRRIANYTSYAMSAAVLGPWLTKKPDLIYVYHPPPTSYIPAVVLKLLYRVPVVYDIQDFWPDTLAATGFPGFNNKTILKLVDMYCKTLYKAANKIVVLSPGFKKKLIQKNVPEDKIEVIFNWAIDSEITPSEPNRNLAQELGFTGKFNILFAGNMGPAQRLEAVLQAARITYMQQPEIQFVFIGGGIEADHLKKTASEMKLENVRFLARRPPSEIDQVLALADVLLVHLKDDPLFEITIPSKIQAYLAVGKPVLVAVPGDAADLVHQAKAGLSCPSENPEQLAKMAQEFYHMDRSSHEAMGRAGRQYYLDNLSMEKGVQRFEQTFKETIEASKQRQGITSLHFRIPRPRTDPHKEFRS